MLGKHHFFPKWRPYQHFWNFTGFLSCGLWRKLQLIINKALCIRVSINTKTHSSNVHLLSDSVLLFITLN